MGKPSSPQGTRARIYFATTKAFAFCTVRLWRKIRLNAQKLFRIQTFPYINDLEATKSSSPQKIPSDKLFRRLQSFRFNTCNSGSQGVVVQGGANEQHRSGISLENLLLPRGLERGFISPPRNLTLFAPWLWRKIR